MRRILSQIAVLVQLHLSQSVSDSCEDQALGMENSTIPDEWLESSSVLNSGTPAKNARLRFSAGSSWCAQGGDATPYLQVDLGSLHAVCAVATQGNSKEDQWVETYQLQTSTDGTTWTNYTDEGEVQRLQGNFDRNTVITQVLFEGLVARFVRVMPKEWYRSPCLRVELYGAKDRSCRTKAIGVADPSKVPNYRMTATSFYDSRYVPSNGRLNVDYSWTPKTTKDRNDYLQLDLGGVHFICAVATQGSSVRKHQDWTTQYKILMSLDNFSWSLYEENRDIKLFAGNNDTNTVKKNSLANLPRAKFIRFQPTADHDWPSLRVEIYGTKQGCRSSLGIEGGSIKDSQITAQSNTNNAHNGRLYGISSWCSKKTTSGYLQVDLGEVTTVTGVATQGNPSSDRWIKTYIISYALHDLTQWQRYKLEGENSSWKTFDGNVNKKEVRVNWFPVPIVARYIRVVASSWTPSGSRPCLRIDLYGCKKILRPRMSLKSMVLTLTKGSFVDVTCNVTSQSYPVIQWWHNAVNVTSLSAGVIRSNKAVDSYTLSTIRVNFTSVGAIATAYDCARNNLSSRAAECVAFSCTAFYQGLKSETTVTRSAAVTVTLYVPDDPSSVEVRTVQARMARIHWSKPSQGQLESTITSFLIHYRTKDDPYNVTMVTILAGKESCELWGLKPYTNYNLKMAAISSVGEGLWSKTVEFATVTASPEDPPLLLSVLAMTSDIINVTWKRPGRINGQLLGYRLSFISDGGTEQVKSVEGDTRTLELLSLNKWTKYTIRVQVFNAKGYGPYSEEKTVRTKEDVPSSPPSSVVVSVINSTSVHVSWKLPPKDSRNGLIRGFKITYKKVHGDINKTLDITGNATLDVTLSDLSIYTEYVYQIRAFTIGDGKISKPEYFNTSEDAPTAPRNLNALLLPAAVGLSPRVNLTWGSPTRENGVIRKYLLYFSEKETQKVSRWEISSSRHWFLISVYGKTTYRFCLSAVTIKEGPNSTVENFVIPEYVPSSSPRGVAVDDFNATAFNVSWRPLTRNQSNGIVIAYEVKYGYKQHARVAMKYSLVNTTERSVLLLDLLLCTLYSVAVRAYTGTGPGPYSHTFLKYSSAPSAPRDLNVVSFKTTEVILKWRRPAYFNGDIKFYTIFFRGTKDYKPTFSMAGNRSVHSEALLFSVTDLVPATKYEFHISATTGCGAGRLSNNAFVTTHMDDPLAPTIVHVTVTNTTGAPVNISIWAADDVNGPISAYQVIVLKTNVKNDKLPLDYISKLRDYERSTENNTDYYITAEVSAEAVAQPSIFTLADGRRYGDYVNAALEKKRDYYNVYERAISRTKTRVLFGEAGLTAVVQLIQDDFSLNRPQRGDGGSVTMIVVGVVTAFAVLAALLVAVVIARRRRYRSTKEANQESKRRDLSIRWLKKSQTTVSKSNLLSEPEDGSSIEMLRGQMEIEEEKDEEEEEEGSTVADERCKDNKDITAAALVAEISEGEFDPAEIYSEASDSSPRPIPVVQFIEHLARMRQHDNVRLKVEYKKLPSGQQGKWSVAKNPANKPKNRYGNIVAYDHSRVVLESVSGIKCSDYINASYLKGFDETGRVYIATQGPNLATFKDFWCMMWQEKSTTIVMLTNLMEKGKRKCHQYWPDTQQSYGQVEVTNHKTEMFADSTIRTFLVVHRESKEKRQVRQFHFTSWPDKGVPQHATAVLGFRRKVHSIPNTGPTVVHCSAGVGRTGAYIVIDAMLDRAKEEGTVDTFNYVKSIRADRMHMIQTVEQYVFVHVAILEALTCGNTEIPASDLTIATSKLDALVPALGITGYEAEFQRLQLVSSHVEGDCDVALRPANATKNRHQDCLPLDSSRVVLKADKQGNDYINASFADAFRERNAFIMTQAPLESTIEDFWRMILQYKIGTSVILNNLQERQQIFPQHWPTEGSKTYGNICVELLSITDRHEDVIHRKFSITSLTDLKRKQNLEHFQHIRWPDKSVPSNNQAVLDLLSMVQRSQQNSGNGPIVVQCSNGIGRSGTFCSMYSLLEKVNLEQVIDVLQIVKILRVKRPGAVETLEQYRFCYGLAQEYLDSFSDYSNFSEC